MGDFFCVVCLYWKFLFSGIFVVVLLLMINIVINGMCDVVF